MKMKKEDRQSLLVELLSTSESEDDDDPPPKMDFNCKKLVHLLANITVILYIAHVSRFKLIEMQNTQCIYKATSS